MARGITHVTFWSGGQPHCLRRGNRIVRTVDALSTSQQMDCKDQAVLVGASRYLVPVVDITCYCASVGNSLIRLSATGLTLHRLPDGSLGTGYPPCSYYDPALSNALIESCDLIAPSVPSHARDRGSTPLGRRVSIHSENLFTSATQNTIHSSHTVDYLETVSPVPQHWEW
jgi:hypothetical protein